HDREVDSHLALAEHCASSDAFPKRRLDDIGQPWTLDLIKPVHLIDVRARSSGYEQHIQVRECVAGGLRRGTRPDHHESTDILLVEGPSAKAMLDLLICRLGALVHVLVANAPRHQECAF